MERSIIQRPASMNRRPTWPHAALMESIKVITVSQINTCDLLHRILAEHDA
jgi:hypothetical protein